MALEQVQNLPQQYVTDLGVDYGKQLAGLTSIPLDTARLAPQVAGQDPLQQQAYNLATSGVGAYQPFLTQAGAYDTAAQQFGTQAAGTLTGAGALGTQAAGTLGGVGSTLANIANFGTAAQGYSGPQAYSQFMSPYQQDVIDATLSEFDTQAAKGLSGIGQLAAQSGNLGGGREGVMRSEYQTQSNLDRAALEAQLRQQNFQQAQQGAQTAFGQMQQMGADQQRMAQLAPQLYGGDIGTLGSAGATQQAQAQAVLDQQREANRMAAYEPYERLGYFGTGIGGLFGSAMGQYQSQVTPNQSPLQQALGIASMGLGAYKALK